MNSVTNTTKGTTPALRPPHRATLPLWLALLLKRQRRASIVPPPWLHPDALQEILERETSNSFGEAFTDSTPLPSTSTSESRRGASTGGEIQGATPPFQESSTATSRGDTLPYHYLELSTLLVTHCADDIPDFELVQRLLRDLREVRMAKVRGLVPKLDGGAGVKLNGIGALELGESRMLLTGVVDGLRKLTASRELSARERAEEEGAGLDGRRGGYGDEDEDDEML